MPNRTLPADKKQIFLTFMGAFFAVLVAVAWLAPGAFTSLALAFALAYLINPAVDWLEQNRVPRAVSIILLMLLALVLVAVTLSFLIPYLWKEAFTFIKESPQLVEQALARVAEWRLLPEEMTRSIPELLNELKSRLLAGGWSSFKPIFSGLVSATSGLVGGVLTVASLVIIPVFFFFILKDIEQIQSSLFRYVPESIKDWVRDYLAMMDEVLSGFIRGQIIVAVCLAALYSLGLGLAGIRFGVLIGVVAGLLFIVPYVGSVLGIIAASMVLLVDFSGWGQVAAVAATFTIAQLIESYVLTPRIVGNRVGLNQLETLIVILIGGEMAGLAGLIMAIPAGGILKRTMQLLLSKQLEEVAEEQKGSE
jgi:predicted PurR-regulated permease PerM